MILSLSFIILDDLELLQVITCFAKVKLYVIYLLKNLREGLKYWSFSKFSKSCKPTRWDDTICLKLKKDFKIEKIEKNAFE